MSASRSRFALGLIGGAIAVVLIIILGSRCTDTGPDLNPSQTRSGSVLSFSMKTLDGEVVPMSRFSGQVVFLNYWATWCAPCRMEMPSIQALYLEKKDQMAFVCISEEEAATVQKFMNQNRYTFPVYLLEGKLPDALSSQGIPATYFIDKRGRVVFSHVGAADWNQGRVKEFLENLIKEE